MTRPAAALALVSALVTAAIAQRPSPERAPDGDLPAWAAGRAGARQDNDFEGRRPLPTFQAELLVAAGRFDHDTDASGLDGDAGAALARLRLEGFGGSGFGGGLELEGIGSDDDLFADAGFPDTEAAVGELFVYAGYRLHAPRFRMPMRLGLYGRSYTIDQSALSELELFTVGIKFALQPELSLVENDRVRFSAYASFAFGGGAGEFETEPATNTWDTSSATFGLDLGLRLQARAATIALAYVFRHEAVDESELAAGSVVRAMDAQFQGFGVAIGLSF
jgi:hypothetical protein